MTEPILASQAGYEKRLWVMSGAKAGDNAQMNALATALAGRGWQVDIRELQFVPWELATHFRSRPTLAGTRAGCRKQLSEPWPDLVISSGRRTELAARWVRKQSGSTKLVHLGRPWSRPECFDLVITTPQYRIPPAANVLCNDFPLTNSDQAPPEDLIQWQTTWRKLPKPRIGVLLGGNSGAYVFTPKLAERFALQVAKLNGSILATSSRRTPNAFMRVFAEKLSGPKFIHRWGDQANGNPYKAILASADLFVVTGDSVSMATEALATGKPTFVLDCEPRAGEACFADRLSWKPLSHRLAMRLAPLRYRRDVKQFQENLVREGFLRWLAEDTRPPEHGALVASTLHRELALSADRVEALFESRD